jgi:hypothetical protein
LKQALRHPAEASEPTYSIEALARRLAARRVPGYWPLAPMLVRPCVMLE